jgi:hypothetical protein
MVLGLTMSFLQPLFKRARPMESLGRKGTIGRLLIRERGTTILEKLFEQARRDVKVAMRSIKHTQPRKPSLPDLHRENDQHRELPNPNARQLGFSKVQQRYLVGILRKIPVKNLTRLISRRAIGQRTDRGRWRIQRFVSMTDHDGENFHQN